MPKPQLIALYRQPADESAFMRHYTEVHLPLVRQIPGLERLEVTRLTGNPVGGAPAYFLMATMTYPDEATFQAAMQSEQNAATGRDLRHLPAEVTVMTGSVQD